MFRHHVYPFFLTCMFAGPVTVTVAVTMTVTAAAAEEDILLTVTPQAQPKSPIAQLDRETLSTLPTTEFRTSTIWTAGPQTFTGVALSSLVDMLEIEAEALRAISVSDFAIDIPLDEIGPDAPIIAYLRDGAPMSRRDKGPLWLLYPYDSDKKYQSEVTYTRSVAQLDRIEILD